MMRCNSGGAAGLRSLIKGAGSYTTMCNDLSTDSPSKGFRPVTASNKMQPNEKMSERLSISSVLPCACSGDM